MRKLTMCLIGASSLAFATHAQAATFTFSSGNYVPGVTAPEPLMAPDILELTTGSNKLFTTVTLTNQSGTVNWHAGALFLGSGAVINNQSSWNALGDNSINPNGGAISTFINSGAFSKSVGLGTTTINGIAFVNSGMIDAQTGSINFNGGNATFNAGSVFAGGGEVNINSNATFNGGFTSSNVNFTGGTYTGNAAALAGTADWTAGTFTGSWDVNAGSTLTLSTGTNKLLTSATFGNDGTVNWTAGALFLGSGTQITNTGLWDASGDNSLNPNGGATSSFVNDGIFRKSGGSGMTTINGIAFTNNNLIDAQTGSINFNGGNATFNAGSVFAGGGEVNINSNATFNGGFTSSNVNFTGGTYTGNAAALAGTADWTAGTFTGSWGVNTGATLNAVTSTNKLLTAATLANAGTVNWQAGALFLGSGSQIINTGTITATGDNSINANGGAPSALINNGLIEKTGGSGTTTLANGIGLDNNGTINVLSGTIALPASFTNDGALGGTGTFASTNLTNAGSIAPGAPGATGTLSQTGNYIQSALGSFNVQLASSSASDLFNISGMASLNGTLALSCILSCAISAGDSFVLLDSIGNLSGTFANITTSGFLSGFAYDVIYDYDADLVRLNILNAGMSGGGGAVPEPSNWAMMILGFGLVGGAMRRRKEISVLA